MNTFIYKNVRYCAASLAILVAMGTAYVALQQTIRSGANETQILLAEDTARTLETAPLTAASFAGPGTDISQSLAPFAIVYSASGTPIAGSGKLHGELPKLPSGVLESVHKNGEERLTWQPEANVRSAIVVVEIAAGPNKGSFVVVGRSMRETEKREAALLYQFAAGTLLAAAVLVAGFFLGRQKGE